MKKCFVIPLVLLFWMQSCATKRHTIEVEDIKTETHDSISQRTDSLHVEAEATDTTTLDAALSSQHAEQGMATEIDTSRTVIVTEFGTDGLPVRQTETRQNYVARQQSWSLEDRLQIEAYLEQMRRMSEQYDDYMYQMEACRQTSDSSETMREQRKEPSAIPWYAKWLLIFEGTLLMVMALALVVMIYRDRKNIC